MQIIIITIITILIMQLSLRNFHVKKKVSTRGGGHNPKYRLNGRSICNYEEHYR